MDRRQLLEQARALGKAIAEQPEVQSFYKARESVIQNPDAMRINKEYGEQLERMQRLEMEGKAIEVADKRKLADLQAAMAGNEALKNLARFQADYLMLLEAVQKAMDEASMPAQS